MYDIVNTTLASAVADNGTFTVGYPAGRSAGSYVNGVHHKMFVNQTLFSAPSQFSVSFGASSATVTWLGDTPLPAGAAVGLEFDRFGSDSSPEHIPVNKQIVRAPLTLLSLGSPGTADSDGVSASQSVGAAGNFLINGALASGGKVVFDTPRNVVAAWTTTSILTITGTDVDGDAVVEKSASGTSHTGTKAFATISRISSSAAITSATVGTGVVIGLPVFVGNASQVIGGYKNGVTLPRRAGVIVLNGQITEALLDAATSAYVVSPVAGVIRKVTTVSQGTITTGGVVTPKIATVAVAGAAVTIANSAAAGEIDSATATLGDASTVVAVGTAIELALDSAFNASADLWFSIEIDTSAVGQMSGTLVAGVTSAATATTGDTRGTYAPLTVPDGATAYELLVALSGPDDRGVAQYAG